MPRATLIEIRKVLNTSLTDATPFIAMANALVDEVVVGGTPTLDEARLTMIENWLAAHFITVYEPVAHSETAGPVGATYQGKTGHMLWSSIHGQTAILLDTTGGLSSLQNDAVDPDKTNDAPKVAWVGTGLKTN